MARPRKFDEDDVRARLRDVFWELGYEGTSYADIMEATGLKKGSLYASFGDKRALYQHALSDYDDHYVAPGIQLLSNTEMSAEDRISAFFDGALDAAGTQKGRWGCLLCNAAVDRAPFDGEVEQTVSDMFTRLRTAIETCVEDTAAWDKTDLIWSAYFGARVLVKAGFETNALQPVHAQVMELFD